MKSEKYKLLKYVKIIPTKDTDLYILYNPLNDKAFLINKDLKRILENKEFNNLEDKELRELIEAKVLIPSYKNDEELAHELYLNRLHDKSFMEFTVALTYDCNLRCPYCYQLHEHPYSTHMTMETAKNVIKFIKNAVLANNSKAFMVTLYGGEPLLNFDIGYKIINELYKWAINNGKAFFVSVCTNGTLVNEDILRKLKANTFIHKKMPVLTYTLDGPKDIHDKIKKYTDNRGSFDDIIEAIKLTRAMDIPYVIKLNVWYYNYKHMKRLLDELVDLGLGGSTISIHYVSSIFCKLTSSTLSFPDLDIPFYKIKMELENYALSKGFSIYGEAVINRGIYCINSTDAAYVIDPFGDVYKCWVAMGIKSFRIGYIAQDGVFIPTNTSSNIYIDPFEVSKCRKCPNILLCGGGCSMLRYLRGCYICPPEEFFKHLVKIKVLHKYPSLKKYLV